MNNKHKSTEGFDEMQRYQRNRVGNQMFHLVCGAVILLSVFYDTEVFTFSFHAAATIAVGASMIIYTARVIMLSAFVPASWNTGRGQVIVIVSAVTLCGISVFVMLWWDVSPVIMVVGGFALALIGGILTYIARFGGKS